MHRRVRLALALQHSLANPMLGEHRVAGADEQALVVDRDVVAQAAIELVPVVRLDAFLGQLLEVDDAPLRREHLGRLVKADDRDLRAVLEVVDAALLAPRAFEYGVIGREALLPLNECRTRHALARLAAEKHAKSGDRLAEERDGLQDATRLARVVAPQAVREVVFLARNVEVVEEVRPLVGDGLDSVPPGPRMRTCEEQNT